MIISNNKLAVVSLSGGMDSTTLLLRLIKEGYEVFACSFNYGQKHSVELERAKLNIEYLQTKGYNVKHKIIDLSSAMGDFKSSLTSSDIDTPEGFYADENMKKTVVPNRNAIFSAIVYGQALSLVTGVDKEAIIALGIHAGDHCFSRDTNILTPNGLKTIDLLKSGDSVFSFNLETNTWENDIVTHIVQKNIVENINLIKTPAGNIKLTDEHKVYRLKLGEFSPKYGYNKSIEKVKVSELTENDWLIQPTNLKKEDPEIEIDNHIDLLPIVEEVMSKYSHKTKVLYDDDFVWICNDSRKDEKKLKRNPDLKAFVNVFAWYIAEGWSLKNSYEKNNENGNLWSAQFCQSLKANLGKVELVLRDMKDLGGSYKFEFSKTQHNNVPKEMTVYTSNVLALLLKECGSYSREKKIPSFLFELLLNNKELREEFLFTIGLADGFNTESLYRGFCSTSEVLISQMITLIQLSGYHFTVEDRKTETQYITYSKKGVKSALISLGDAKFTKIKSINVIPYNDNVFDITVQKNHNFLAGENGSLLISNSIYPDCRQEFRDAIDHAFRIGNWESEKISYYAPYLNDDKYSILKDGLVCCEALELDFDIIYKNTNTSYNPDPITGKSSGTSGADVERILAFHQLGRKDPVEYIDTWENVLENALKVEKQFNEKVAN